MTLPGQDARWSAEARLVGIVSGLAVFVIGILYLTTIAAWLILVAQPQEPIGDPYLAVMEVLTLLSAGALVGLVGALWCFAQPARFIYGAATFAFGSLAGGSTMALHFAQLSAVRQLWRAGRWADYRLVWPSASFALEYFAWDGMVGLMMVSAALTVSGDASARNARRALLAGGVLCLAGLAGPLSGWMMLQNLAVAGYGVCLPLAGGLLARAFRDAPAHIPNRPRTA